MMRQHINTTLARLQKIARIDMRYLVSGGFFLSLTQVCSAAIGLLMTVAFANFISPEAYGTYKYVLATYTLLAIAALPGVETAVMRSVAQGHERAFITGVLLKMKWSLLAGLASFIYALYNFHTGEETLGTLFVLVAVAIPFMETGSLYPSYFNAKKQYKLWSLLDIGGQVVSAVALFGVLYFSKSLILLTVAYLVPQVLIRVVLTYVVYSRIPKTATDDLGLKTYARSLTVFQILTRLIASIDQIILFHFLGPAAVAVFSIANAIPGRIKGVLKITGTLSFPKVVKRSGAEMFATMPRKMFLFGLVILLVCVVYVLLVPFVFTYVFPKYHDSIIYSQVLVFFTLSCITYPFSSFLFAHKKIQENYIIAVTSFGIKVLSLVIFVPLYGIWGAIIGILTSALTTVIFTFYFLYAGRNDQHLVAVPNQAVNK